MPEKCSKCGHNITVLFYTKDCGRCSSKTAEWFYHGYVMWTKTQDYVWDVQEHPIFKNAEELNKWQSYNPSYLSDLFETREVLAKDPFDWIPMAYFNCDIADTRYKVTYQLTTEKYKYPTAIMIPSGVLLPDGERILLNKQDRESLGIQW